MTVESQKSVWVWARDCVLCSAAFTGPSWHDLASAMPEDAIAAACAGVHGQGTDKPALQGGMAQGTQVRIRKIIFNQ